MKRANATLLLTFCLALMAFQCKNDDNTADSQDNAQAQLTSLKSEIEFLAQTSVCNDANTCKFIELGSKPCGGPWGYLIYSTSIDTEKLEQLVKNYNKKEKDFNTKWGIISDCAIANPPSNLKCENNICVAEY